MPHDAGARADQSPAAPDEVEYLLRADCNSFLARDFIETGDGMLLAVVANGVEEDRVLCFLRYARDGSRLRKLDTDRATDWLRCRRKDYLYRSRQRDAVVHGIPLADVVHHYRPTERLARLPRAAVADAMERKVGRVAELISGAGGTPTWLGVTGSLLVRAHTEDSDIDLVAYGRENFALARQRLQTAVLAGALRPLDETMWLDAYRRRGCSLTLDEYLWHERRKGNKFACDGTKVDISCVAAEVARDESGPSSKVGRRTLRAQVTDDTCAYDYPARYQINDPQIGEIVCFTPTYCGQACRGELVEAAGWVEQAADLRRRLIVGTTREAEGEYVKVIRADSGT